MRRFLTYRMAPLGTAGLVGLLSVFATPACGNGGDAGPDADVQPGSDADGPTDACNDPNVDCGVFVNEIMPSFESANCLINGCHSYETSTQGFGLHVDVDDASSEMAENFQAVRRLIDLFEPDFSVIYRRSVDGHAAITLPGDDAATLLAWIEDYAERSISDNNPPPTGGDVSSFNVGVFRDDIFPILNGFDLNTGQQRQVGCTSPACHGAGGGAVNFTLDPSRTPEQNLESFVSFVNLANPVRSQALLCAQNLPGCRVYPNHPGGAFFQNANDLNYQRVLGYIYSSADNTPLDLAFFAERIQPIFNDNSFTADGSTNCLDSACHGVSAPGERPGNNTNFPILRNVSQNDLQGITENFVNATAFTNFLDPESSSLFLFPTNQIAHRPGAVIDIINNADHADFVENILLRWIGGLRPDADGFGRHWLVDGPYTFLNNLEDSTGFDERNGLPRYRDPTSSLDRSFWEEEFADDAFVDLGDRFGRNAPRAAYAATYVVNTDSFDIDVRLEVSSENDFHVYFGGLDQSVIGGGTVNLTQRINAFGGEEGDLVRILIKVFEPQDQGQFGFTARFFDNRNNNLLTEDTGELVFVLGPEGGI
jgi:hypothetical protein